MQYLISICVPAYKRTDFLKRLLGSIAIQSWKDFEVIVTDDSPGEDVKEVCMEYSSQFALSYCRNVKALGTPENWNEAIRNAKGQWIKLMHDDDWFADEHSLLNYAETVQKNPEAHFIFSAYRDVFLEEGRIKDVFINAFRDRQLKRNPATLFSQNVVGPPSVVMHRNDGAFLYDKTLKWVVDIDFYIRYFEKYRPFYINRVSINVGIGKEQVTRDCFRQRPVEIPENFCLLNKTGAAQLKNILVYDAWWRLMRNLEIKTKKDIFESGYTGNIPAAILSMIRWQTKMPAFLLGAGICSKCAMLLNYLFNYHRIRN